MAVTAKARRTICYALRGLLGDPLRRSPRLRGYFGPANQSHALAAPCLDRAAPSAPHPHLLSWSMHASSPPPPPPPPPPPAAAAATS